MLAKTLAEVNNLDSHMPRPALAMLTMMRVAEASRTESLLRTTPPLLM